MAQDIIPIELGLPQGDVVTLWAPRWREDGEEWEAFLGDEDDLYAFPDAAHLAAFVRTAERHDLLDHPAWDAVPSLNVPELIPDEDHTYDLVGVPELVAEEPDVWHIAELAEIVGIVRSLADVCDLEEVHEVLDSTEGFSLLDQGTLPFTGNVGVQVWND
ncbi:primosomal protein, partial [Amycolatopsis sp. NPDC051128]